MYIILFCLNFFLFSFSKISVFLAPLIAAKSLSPSSYGQLELYLSLAMSIATVISFGAGNIISYRIIKEGKDKIVNISMLYLIICSFVFSLISIFSYENYLFSFISLFIIQVGFSSYIKGQGGGALSSLVESSIYILLLLISLRFFYSGEELIIKNNFIFIITSLILSILFLSGVDFKNIDIKSGTDLIKLGFPIMVSSCLAVFFVNIPRLILGEISTHQDIATFSIYFRWAAISLIAYQFMNVVFFRRIYTSDYRKIDLNFSFIFIIVILCGLFSSSFINYFGLYIEDYIKTPDTDFSLQFLFLSIVSLWVLSTLLEGFNYKEKKSKNNVICLIVSILFFSIFCFLFSNYVNNKLELVVSIWVISYIIMIFLNLIMISKNNKAKFSTLKILFILIVVSDLFCLIRLWYRDIS